MKLKLPKIKPSKALFSLRYFYILIFILLIGSLIMLGNFLYANFYQTISQTEEIVLLKQEVAPDIIDTTKVEKVLELINRKTLTSEKINFDNILNPFDNIESNANDEINNLELEASSTPEQNATTTN